MRQPDAMAFRPLIFALALLFVSASVLGYASSAHAEAPDRALRIALVNGAEPAGGPVERALLDILTATDRLELVDGEDLLDAGGPHGVTVETLRKGSKRKTHVGAFSRTMREARVDGILVLDVFSGKAQVVTIGPDGRELSDVRRALSGGELPEDRAFAMLEESFETFIPAWRAYQEQTPRPQAAADANRVDATRDLSDAARADEAEPDRSGVASRLTYDGSRPALETGVDIWVGAIAGRHSLKVSSQSSYGVETVAPIVGVGFCVDSVLGRFAAPHAGFGLEVFGAYAPFEVALARAGDSANVPGKFTHLGADLNYLNRLSERLELRLGVGFEALSFMVDSNPAYTGNRYAQLRLTGGLDYRASSLLSVGASAGAAPLMDADMSGGAFSDTPFAPAWLGEATLGLTPLESFRAQFGYRLYYYDVVFRASERVDGTTQAEDLYQMVELSFAYGF